MRIGISRTAGAGLAVAVFVAMFLWAGTAQALTKTRTPVPPADYDFPGACPFTVHIQGVVARQVETDTFDASGNLVRSDFHGRLVERLTNVDTGQSATFNEAGPATVTPNADGSITIVLRGRSVTGDQGLITGEPFLTYNAGRVVIRAVPNSQTGFLDFSSVSRRGHTEDICSLLS
jgi:hypothetical protein